MEFQNQQQQSDDQLPEKGSKKSSNQRHFQFQYPSNYGINHPIIIDSCFPCGNILKASVEYQQSQKIRINIQGNPDVQQDSTAKYWFYFRVRGLPYSDSALTLSFRNANNYRKFLKQKKYRPFIVWKVDGQDWKPAYIQIKESLQQIIAEIQLILKKQSMHKKSLYFALNYPYSMEQLDFYLHQISKRQDQKQKLEDQIKSKSQIYFNVQTLCYSCQFRKVQLITITSKSNVDKTHSQKIEDKFCEELFPQSQSCRQKYFLMNDRLIYKPCLFFSARVHPSQVSSSYFVEGIINFLMDQSDIRSKILRQMFIIYIVPVLNPDGVQCGNYRLDNKLNNLNRFYGQSSFEHTPSIKAVQLFLQTLSTKGKDKIIMYFDIHGHNSPKPSFIYGNFTKNTLHLVENRYFCKIFEKNNRFFSLANSDFSQRNMNAKQKYDEFSKLYTGRAFVGKSSQNGKKQQTNDVPEAVQHSYTLQIMPYKPVQGNTQKQKIFNSLGKDSSRKKLKIDSISTIKKQYQSIKNNDMRSYHRQLGKDLLISILDLFQMNPITQQQGAYGIFQRTIIYRELVNSLNSDIKKIYSGIYGSSQAGKTFSRNLRNQIYEKANNQYFQRWFNDKRLFQIRQAWMFQIRDSEVSQKNNDQKKLVNFIQNGRKYHRISHQQSQRRQLSSNNNEAKSMSRPNNQIKIQKKYKKSQWKNQDQQTQEQDIYIKRTTGYNKKLLVRSCKREFQINKCVPGQIDIKRQVQQERNKKLQKQLSIIRQMCMRSLSRTQQPRYEQVPVDFPLKEQFSSVIKLNDFNKISVNGSTQTPSKKNQTNKIILSQSVRQRMKSNRKKINEYHFIQRTSQRTSQRQRFAQRFKFKTQVQVEQKTFRDDRLNQKVKIQKKVNLGGQIQKMLRRVTKKANSQQDSQAQFKNSSLKVVRHTQQQHEQFNKRFIQVLNKKQQNKTLSEQKIQRYDIIHQIDRAKMSKLSIQSSGLSDKANRQMSRIINTEKLPSLNLKIEVNKGKNYKSIENKQQQQKISKSPEKRERVRYSYKNRRNREKVEQSNRIILQKYTVAIIHGKTNRKQDIKPQKYESIGKIEQSNSKNNQHKRNVSCLPTVQHILK